MPSKATPDSLREATKRDRKGNPKEEKMSCSEEETPLESSEEIDSDSETALSDNEIRYHAAYDWYENHWDTIMEIHREVAREKADLYVPTITKSEVALALSRAKAKEAKNAKSALAGIVR